jgi:hypothetical protein
MAYTTTVTPEWVTDRKGRNPELRGQKLDVYLFVKRHKYCTRNDVAKALGMKSSTATARIKELIDAGIIYETNKKVIGSAGVSNKTLFVSENATHKSPKDRVRIKVSLIVDEGGNYHAKAEVIGGFPVEGKPHVVLTKEITLIAPYPNEYYHSFSEEQLTAVPVENTVKNLNLIVDNQ